MSSNVEDLTAFYNNLPSIVETGKSYQPMFGSFAFADSDPLSRAAFVTAAPPTAEAPPASDDFDEDDFDGIPIRHSSTNLTKTRNGESDALLQNSARETEVEDDAYLNAFNDERAESNALVPSLFKDIPDIDDPNQPDEEDADSDDRAARVPFDHMDMFDQSDSVRSSSPDSLLSSSHLQDDDDEVAQWNDELILNTTSSQLNFPAHRHRSLPHEQVDFIDSSRSHSRGSNLSSQLSNGYADQARIFMSDDELSSSSASDEDHDETSERADSEELCLQVNLDDHRSPRSITRSASSRSSSRPPSPTPDGTPIVSIDEDNEEANSEQVAPMAALDDDDDDDDETVNVHPYNSDRLIFPLLKTPLELQTDRRRHELLDEIMNMRQLLDANEQNDEFIAVMHNPALFEEALHNYSHNGKRSNSIKQANSVTNTFGPSSQLSVANEIEKKPLERLETAHRRYPSSDSYGSARQNNSSPMVINHLARDTSDDDDDDVEGGEEQAGEEKIPADAFDSVDDTTTTLHVQQKKQYLPCRQTNTSAIDVKQFARRQTDYPVSSMDSDDDDGDDLELLQTLSQFHGVLTPAPFADEHRHLSVDASSNLPDSPTNEVSRNENAAAAVVVASSSSSLQPTPTSHQIAPSSPSLINTSGKTDGKQEEKAEKKFVILAQNLNNDEDASTSSTLFNDDSQSPVVFVGPDTSSSLPNLLLPSGVNFLPLRTNARITDDLQISNPHTNMNRLPTPDLLDQTTSNLFDPFAPTSTTTTTTTSTPSTAGMFDDGMRSHAPLANYNFDELWNQSVSHLPATTNDEFDPNTFAWGDLVNPGPTKSNPFSADNDDAVPTIDLTWNALLGESEQDGGNDLKQFLSWIISHLDGVRPTVEFTSTHNLESIINEMQMSTRPFTPIPSPPLHVDHTVGNPMINAVHHNLFPIDELEQLNVSQAPASMVLYEEDESETSEVKNVAPVAEKLVSNVLGSALAEFNQPDPPVERFVDQILAQAVFEVHEEAANEPLPTDNLASIISWHDQAKATNKQLPDPFDQQFDSVWSQHFQAPDHTTNEDPFQLANAEHADSPALFSRTFDDSDPFASSGASNAARAAPAANDLLQYTFTAPVTDDSGDDDSTFDDYFAPRKSAAADTHVNNEPTATPEVKVREQRNQENFFATDGRLSQFEAFASDQPLYTSAIDSKFANITSQFDDDFNATTSMQQSTDDNAPWVSVEKPLETSKSTDAGDNEPWELEEHGDEKLTPVPTTARLTVVHDNAFPALGKSDSQQNFFSDSFNPPVLPETQSNDEHDNDDVRAPTPTSDAADSDSEDLDVDDITPSFNTDAKIEHPAEAMVVVVPPAASARVDHEEVSPPSKPPRNPSVDNIPLKSAVILPNTDTHARANTRPVEESTPTTAATIDVQAGKPFDSALLRATSIDTSAPDADETQEVIACIIDNNAVNIDAKTIAPFKCVISSAGTLPDDNQTAVIAIYGCWLPDHRLREYRYIMDQLFYYVYHKLDKLVTNDYVLIYFHGATPKHRTPDLKFLRKCYQMINFRLRKNLRSVYVVHPTRWLRTVIALSRPFFSNKFYHKVNYVYTIAELERQFPNNRLSIPVAIEQTDWLYSQKYDRENASIQRSIAQRASQCVTNSENESVA